jgi:hypothetical protein
MPTHNYTAEDLLSVLRAISVFPAFLFFPGYAIAWSLDLLDFRRRTIAFRTTLAVPLSIAVCPILTYTLARFASLSAVWVFYIAAALLFTISFVLDLRGRGFVRPLFPGSRPFAIAVAVWLGICLFALTDLQIGDRLYYPSITYDYAARSAFVQSISAAGIPARNPFFLPGHPVLLRYHYFWLMMCSLAHRSAGPGVSARHAVVAGTFWIGVGMMALLAIYLRLFHTGPRERIQRRLLVGVALLAITGLDILPSLFFWFLYGRGLVPFVQPGVELWNEHVEWFLSTVVNTPHAVAALIACFLAFLMLWRNAWSARTIVAAALALATAAGCCIFVVFVFAVFLAVWTAVALYQHRYRETAALCLTGVLSLLLACPYLQEIAGSGTGRLSLQFTVRAFSFTALIRTGTLSNAWRLILVNLPLVPLNYLLEFGLFFLVARHKWRQQRESRSPLPRADLAMTIMAVISTLICTFLSSGVTENNNQGWRGFNDLGWRGFLIAQFVLLLWAVDIFGDRESLGFLAPAQKQLLAVFFALGFAGTATDLAIARLYPLLADRGVVPVLDWMSPDRDLGHRTYAARKAYQWIRGTTPDTATVQDDPTVLLQDNFGMLYGDRPYVAADSGCATGFGGNPKECSPIIARLHEIFPVKGNSAAPTLQDVCHSLPLDIVVAKDIDPAWSDRSSWVWTERPAYANSHVRVFRCNNRSSLAAR